jgi:tRNA G18 (ribose-2'-O)-methylase SpoU
LTNNKQHQGVCIKTEPRAYFEIKKFHEIKKLIKKDTGNIILLVEKISDPVNLGIISRTCVYLGIDMLIVGKDERPPITAQMAKISNGASECINIFSIKFIKQFLQEANKSGWTIISNSLEKGDKTIGLQDLPIVKDKNYILLLSEEESDLTENTLSFADHRVFIPPVYDDKAVKRYPYNIVGSMNIGVISALLVDHIKTKLKF